MTASLLAQIDGPSDVKRLGLDELQDLAAQLREEIVRVTAANGGHLATNLGSVELSIALHHALDSPRDKIIWDVGNQCYAHKLITGRRERFKTLRQTDGLSGFVTRFESPHDHLSAGHAATALSAALGIASARDQLGDDYSVVAIVGDGAMSAGLSYEALNNLGTFQSQLLLVLNDNSFSISPSCGALARTFKRAQERVLDGNIFEQLGIQYLGPVDGHDLPLLIEVLRDARQADRPIVLHIVTQKGKGFAPAEQNPTQYHGLSPFDIESGRPLASKKGTSYSEQFGNELLRIAEEDDRVVAITAAMTTGTGLEPFAKRFPHRFHDVGLAEQHAVTFAGGLALGGCRPVVAIYSTFLQRSFDQILHDVRLQNLPVTFVLDRAGLVGADGPTHHGVFDLSFLRTAPRMVMMVPKDGEELSAMLRAAIQHDGPAAIRIPRGTVVPPAPGQPAMAPIEIGRGELLREGQDVAFLAVGSMVPRALEAAEELGQRGVSAGVVNARFIKPLDADLILDTAARVDHIFTIEEHVLHGGFGSAVLELFAEHRVQTPVTVFALPDEFIEHGATEKLLDDRGLSTEKIVSRVLLEREAEPGDAAHPAPKFNEPRLRAAIARIMQRSLPEDLRIWVDAYGKVGDRDPFLWKWCLEGVDLTTLSCVEPDQRDANRVTKVLGVMVDVLLDDVADQANDSTYLEWLLKIPVSPYPPDFSTFLPEQQAYADTLGRVWETIMTRARCYPRFEEYRELLRFDYMQLLNTMRYSQMINRDPRVLNIIEHDLYLPHNMHMMISGTLDLMCSPSFERAELGRLRAVLWHAQCMGRIGNLITTWERELAERDFTSGVFALALQRGYLNVQQLMDTDTDVLREAISSRDCESFFLNRWRHHRTQIIALANSIQSVDVSRLVDGLEQLLEIHLGSRGLK